MSDSKSSGLKVFLLFLAPMLLNGQKIPENSIPLKNWATPLYWQSSQGERGASGRVAPELKFSPNAISANALTFIAITPCRLVDTRGATAGFNGIAPFSGPSISPAGTITIPVQSSSEASANTTPAPCGQVPLNAEAYSFNLTVVPHAGGAVNYVSMWPAGSAQPFVATLNDPQGAIVANAAIVPAGTPTGGISVFNAGPAIADVIIDMNGYFTAPTDGNTNTAIGTQSLSSNTSGEGNTAVGFQSMQSNTSGIENTANGWGAMANNLTGGFNTATGYGALYGNTVGNSNTANGYLALQSNTSGNGNVAMGNGALEFNTTGSDNTATGTVALLANTIGSNNTASGFAALTSNSNGSNNTAFGFDALQSSTNGTFNTAVGANALQSDSTGLNNTAVGYLALQNITTGGGNIGVGIGAGGSLSSNGANNIDIGNFGVSGDSSTIRIGTSGTHSSFFAAGIAGVTSAGGVPVMVNASGQLGTVSSSRRYKEDIQDMGDASSALMRLRPVTFRYKQAYPDGSKPIDYGLIAEEVAAVYPDLVAHSLSGEVETVQYQKVNAMLLNEVQKQHTQIEEQDRRAQSQQDEMAALKARLTELEKQLELLAATPASSR